MKTLKKGLKAIKAIVPRGSAGLMRALVLSMFFVSLFFLNSYADDGKDLIEAAKKATSQKSRPC